MPSPSSSRWSGLLIVRQLSHISPTPSASVSVWLRPPLNWQLSYNTKPRYKMIDAVTGLTWGELLIRLFCVDSLTFSKIHDNVAASAARYLTISKNQSAMEKDFKISNSKAKKKTYKHRSTLRSTILSLSSSSSQTSPKVSLSKSSCPPFGTFAHLS